MIILDASVAVKWFIREISSDEADRLLGSAEPLFAPDLFVIEVAAALVRKANMDKSNRSASEAGLASFGEMLAHDVVRIEATRMPDMMAASRLALDLGHPLKDCIYLALAMKMGCELLT
ncbi:MAG: type II toxin-antitoxin system VapC family toxin, partial [Novosphingobium sp.]|nr:type II toxin-antitoxin system VapC family toxin [Novosphingobium sp.]